MSGEKKEFIVSWIIENYFFYPESNRCCLSSPIFKAKNLNCTEWYICLYPRGESEATKDYVSLHFIRYCSTDFKDFNKVDLNVKLCNANDEVIFSSNQETSVKKKFDTFYISKVLRLEELEEKMKKFSKDNLIIRCRMSMDKNPDEKNSTKNTCSIRTFIGFDKFSFIWKAIHSDSKDILMKKMFTDMNQTKFETILRTSDDDVLIEISRIGRYQRNHKVKCHVYLLNSIDTVNLSSSDFFFFDCKSSEKNVWRFPSFLKKSLLFGVPHNSCNVILFNFFISNDMNFKEYDEKTIAFGNGSSLEDSEFSPPIVSLQDDLLALMSDEKYADVQFLVDEEIIRGHKSILASRSPVFKTMFDQDMIESQTGTINIPDINVKTMKLFLKFLYTGTLDQLDLETALELLLAAEKYQVPSLKNKCSRTLMTLSLNADSVCDVISVADMVGAQVLKTSALSYIEKNVLKVLGSPNWPKWLRKNGELGSEILCKVSEKTVNPHSDM